jgi:predicted CoA-binding protein
MIAEALENAGYKIVNTIPGNTWHLYDKYKALSEIKIKIDKRQFTFTTNPGGCGSVMMAGNIDFQHIKKEDFEKVCNILAEHDAGTIFAVLGINHKSVHKYMLEFGFTVIAEYPNLRHDGQTQWCYMKVTPKQ